MSDTQRTFAEQQRQSHHDLRESDPKYAEYHRGAELAYALMAERLGGEPAAVTTGQAWPEGSPERRRIERRTQAAHDLAADLAAGEGWKGTPPAEGTRRALIRDTIERTFAGKVKPGTRELVVVLEDVSDADHPPEYRFIELEDQDGASVGGFGIKPSSRKPFLEITIPYGRDDGWVSEVAYQAAGAATRPLMEDHGDYVFPAARVSDAVAELLTDFGIPRACTDCAEEQIGHGRKEMADRDLSSIADLEDRIQRVTSQREDARIGEDRSEPAQEPGTGCGEPEEWEPGEAWPPVYVVKDTTSSLESGWSLRAPGDPSYDDDPYQADPHKSVRRYIPAPDPQDTGEGRNLRERWEAELLSDEALEEGA